MNDTIPSRLCSLKYVTVNHVAMKAVSLGKGTLLDKICLQTHTYCTTGLSIPGHEVEGCNICRW